ncbi:hypothetical protein [Anabaena sp. UHCC 0451]|uniref:hypothetical protein n=1 Tax=Anabaena sp. UHCC 0451 TaxID=2055235 RepID=UPI002B2079BF|nr:hypothetical protein [Anabaena sp. UHCC 0451]MEA5578811.1 hypothetical protein [Anabaena sp. UHCC 0451]
MNQEQEFCFCTLALGKRYRSHTLLLAQDIEKYSPGTKFVVLTDQPQEFSNYSHILAFKHQQNSIGCYHDKRFVIAQALELFNTCIFVDADIRILEKVSPDMEWLPGVTARSCASIVKHNKEYIGSVKDPASKARRFKDLEIIDRIAKKLDLNLEDTNIKFVMEMLFVVTKQDGKEREFINHWEKIALYCELNNFYNAEGYAIGLAAAKAGLVVRWDSMDGLVYFKDWIERQKIKKGQANPEDSLVYFQQHEVIECRQKTLLQKIINKLNKFISYYYRSFVLKLIVLKDFNFYYR